MQQFNFAIFSKCSSISGCYFRLCIFEASNDENEIKTVRVFIALHIFDYWFFFQLYSRIEIIQMRYRLVEHCFCAAIAVLLHNPLLKILTKLFVVRKCWVAATYFVDLKSVNEMCGFVCFCVNLVDNVWCHFTESHIIRAFQAILRQFGVA